LLNLPAEPACPSGLHGRPFLGLPLLWTSKEGVEIFNVHHGAFGTKELAKNKCLLCYKLCALCASSAAGGET